jgi:hypothetical protein
MDTPVAQGPPAATPAPGPSPARLASQKALAAGAAVSLALALLTLVGCTTLLFIFLAKAVTEAPPKSEGTDTLAISRFSMEQTYRQQERVEQRAAVLRSSGLLLGVAVAFIALTALLAAARAEAVAPKEDAGPVARLARLAPALVALVCATLIIILAAPESKPATTGLPLAFPAPVSVAPQ